MFVEDSESKLVATHSRVDKHDGCNVVYVNYQ